MPTVPGDEQMAQQQQQWLQSLLHMGQQGSQVNTSNPFGSQTWSTDANGNRTLTQGYTPGITGDFNSQLANRAAGSQVAQAGASGILPTIGKYNTANVNAPGIQYGANPSSMMTGYGRDTFQAIPGASDFQGNQQAVQDALYARQTANLDPQFEQQQNQLDAKLRNQGFQAGDKGADDAQGNLARAKNNAYAGARNDSIAGGQAVASNLLADALRIRGTQNAEGQQDYTNYNTAAGTNFNQRATNVALNNTGQQQAVSQYGTNFSVPMQQYLASLQGAPTGSMVPNFGTGTTALAQPNSPSFLDFTSLGAQNSQANANRNTNIASSVAGGVGSLLGGSGGLLSGIGNMFSNSPDLSTMSPITSGAMTDMIPQPDWSSYFGF